MRAKSSKQRCPALCILRLELLQGWWLIWPPNCQWKSYDFLGVDHEGRQTFRL